MGQTSSSHQYFFTCFFCRFYLFDQAKSCDSFCEFVINVSPKAMQMILFTGKLSHRKPTIYMVLFALVFYLWIILLICEVEVTGISYVAWTIFLFFIVYCAGVRINLRERYKIDGNMVEDFFAGKSAIRFCFYFRSSAFSFHHSEFLEMQYPQRRLFYRS